MENPYAFLMDNVSYAPKAMKTKVSIVATVNINNPARKYSNLGPVVPSHNPIFADKAKFMFQIKSGAWK